MTASRKKTRKQPGQPPVPLSTDPPVVAGPVDRPLLAARMLCMILLPVGAAMLILGGGVAMGRITQGWGFPMSSVPNWGRLWGVVLLIAGMAYIVGPIRLFQNPRKGSVVMMIVSGLSVLVGTPLITSAVEIGYNLFQETKSRPDWVDSVWGYTMLLHVAILIALCKTYPVIQGTQSDQISRKVSS